jgi:hypothetical protein
MYKNNIIDSSIASLYQVINEINETHPLWWECFVDSIIGNSKATFINQTTIIIGVYELNVQEVIILYNILKKFKNYKLIDKVINKKEFLIIHINNQEVMNYLIEPAKWLNLVVYKFLSEYYNINSLQIETTDESLKFIYQGTVYHFFTNPQKEYKSNKYHKYIYLYKDLYIRHLKLIDNKLKYIRCKEEFYKNFQLMLEKIN